MPDTALDQVERLLQLIPLAGRDGGIPYDELADALAIDRTQLDRDLETLTTRDFYLPGGAVNDLQVFLEEDRVRIWTMGPLRRPPRLTAGELAALDLGLRLTAQPVHGSRESGHGTSPAAAGSAIYELLRRVGRSIPSEAHGHVVADGDPDAGDAVRGLVEDAARRGRKVALSYLKADAREPGPRTVAPYVVARAEGRGYVLGLDDASGEVRAFRLDRVLEARVTDDEFAVPDDFDPGDWLEGGRVYRADDALEVAVRYTPRVARWVIESGEGEVAEDGSVVVTHAVADPGWIVRHVLRYGADAEVVGPAEVRGWVVEALSGLDESESPLAVEGA